MRTGGDQRPRGRPHGGRPSQPQQRTYQGSQTFNSNGPGDRVRGNALQLYERYLTLAQEAARGDDRVAAQSYYQHAEHYFRVNKAAREGQRADGERADGQHTDGQPAYAPPVERTAAEAGPAPASPGESEPTGLGPQPL